MKKSARILLGSGIGVLVAALVVRLFLMEWIPSIFGLLGLGAIFVCLSVIVDFNSYREIFAMKTTKNGLSFGAVVILVFAILVSVNYIGHVRNVKWDVSKEKLNSLSDQSVTLLKALEGEVEFRGFYRPGANDQEDAAKAMFENLVRMYQAESSKVKLFVFDPFKRRDLAEKYKVITGDIVISIGEKQTIVSDISEQVFTNAIVKLTRNTKNIYSLDGHGERDINGMDGRGAGQFKRYLEDEGYKVNPLSLARTGSIPKDAAVIMVLGPTQALADSELKLLGDYLGDGGRIFLALDPGGRSNISKLSSEMGIEFLNQYVRDQYGQLLMKSPDFALGLQYSGSHEVTSKIKKVQTIFPGASPLRRAPNAAATIQTDELVMTELSAYAVNKLSEFEADDRPPKQQFTLAMATKGKLNEKAPRDFAGIVVGDSDFLSNDTIDVLGANRDLALNILASLSNESEMITIRPRQSHGTPVVLSTAENGGLVALIGFVPLSMFAFAFISWWRRRGA